GRRHRHLAPEAVHLGGDRIVVGRDNDPAEHPRGDRGVVHALHHRSATQLQEWLAGEPRRGHPHRDDREDGGALGHSPARTRPCSDPDSTTGVAPSPPLPMAVTTSRKLSRDETVATGSSCCITSRTRSVSRRPSRPDGWLLANTAWVMPLPCISATASASPTA